MTKYWRMFRAAFGVSTSTMLIYRSNVFFFLGFEVLFLSAQFLSVKVGFDLAGGSIAGWSRSEVYFLTAVNGLSHQIFICFFINPLFNLQTQVWNGQFDYLLLKPVHPLLSMFFHGQFAISNLPTAVLNLVAVVGLLAGGDVPLGAAQVAAFTLFFLTGVAVRIALGIACMAPVFLSERVTDSEEAFWSLASLGKYPLTIFPRAVELALTFVVPVGMMAALPAAAVFKADSAARMLAAFACSLGFIAAGVRVFRAALGRYQSVNSGV
jgi:ABC-2 type transport system permease protein